MRWCVKARDGWHFSVPNKPHSPEAASVKTACGYFVTLPYGCERRTTTCKECLDALTHQSKKEMK